MSWSHKYKDAVLAAAPGHDSTLLEPMQNFKTRQKAPVVIVMCDNDDLKYNRSALGTFQQMFSSKLCPVSVILYL